MKLFEQVTTDADEMFVYFEVIRQLHPNCVLDYGMLLKRMGAITRQAVHCTIQKETRLEGVDICPQIQLPIYHTIYDQIYPAAQLPQKSYDLAIFLGQANPVDGTVLDYLSAHASVILFDADIAEITNYFTKRFSCQSLSVDHRTFGLAHCKGM